MALTWIHQLFSSVSRPKHHPERRAGDRAGAPPAWTIRPSQLPVVRLGEVQTWAQHEHELDAWIRTNG